MTDDAAQGPPDSRQPADRRACPRAHGSTGAEDELLAALLIEESRREAGRARSRRRRRVFARVGVAVAAIAVVLVALLSLRDGSGDRGSGTAWAAEHVRFAEASPLVLLGAPGWRVEYADERVGGGGRASVPARAGTSARPGPSSVEETAAGPDPRRHDAARPELARRGDPGWREDRAASAALTTTAPVLGTTARVYQYMGGTPGHRDITALFRYDGRVLEFRAGAATSTPSRCCSRRWSASTRTPGCLRCRPAWSRPPDREVTISQMLPGRRRCRRASTRRTSRASASRRIATSSAPRSRGPSRASGSSAGRTPARRTIASRSARRPPRWPRRQDWPILQRDGEAGRLPGRHGRVRRGDALGRWYGRPLTGDVNSGLGCDGLGVDLP